VGSVSGDEGRVPGDGSQVRKNDWLVARPPRALRRLGGVRRSWSTSEVTTVARVLLFWPTGPTSKLDGSLTPCEADSQGATLAYLE